MRLTALLLTLLLSAPALAALPDPPKDYYPFPIPFTSSLNLVSAADLLEKPAGKAGPILAKDGHFFTADDKRIRFWGVNTAFSANFPTHTQADAVALRLASLGINCVRLHHMDSQKFPNGIFADDTLETLSPEALDRLDYFIAALKKQGIYVNLNLHVSRPYARTHKFPNADQLDGDKIVDIFYPPLIAAQKQYAKDLLTHINAYTKTAYAAEPAIAMVEINNEDSLFLWGGDQKIASLPDPYAATLTQLWNQSLLKKYTTREKLAAAWKVGAQDLGENMLEPELFAKDDAWNLETHEKARAKLDLRAVLEEGKPKVQQEATVTVTTPGDLSWHVQLTHPKLKLRKGQFYTVEFAVTAKDAAQMSVSVSQAGSPWASLGLSHPINLKPNVEQWCRVGFVATANEDNARIQFILGNRPTTYSINKMLLAEGGQIGLDARENPRPPEDFVHETFFHPVARRTPGDPVSQPRQDDWFDFLQQTDESFFTSMRDYLKKDLGVKAPITGTIGLGALGTMSQSKMDFVDAHAYWDHPQFPHQPWDPKDWQIKNTPMVDSPESATLWQLAATRVAGKPFTVTEYNHAAPNEYQSECIPLIASFAAAQDWDAVFLFAYSHSSKFENRSEDSFFDVEGNAAKLAQMPFGARIFIGRPWADESSGIPKLPPMVKPFYPNESQATRFVAREDAIRQAPTYSYQLWNQLRDQDAKNPKFANWPIQRSMLESRFAITFDPKAEVYSDGDFPNAGTSLKWNATKPGAGQYYCWSSPAFIFAGFVADSPVSPAWKIENSATPFVTFMAVPTDEKPKQILLCVVARSANTGMTWNPARTSVSDQWGKGPAQLERVDVTLSLPVTPGKAPPKVIALTPEGKPGEAMKVETKDNRFLIHIKADTPWFQLTR